MTTLPKIGDVVMVSITGVDNLGMFVAQQEGTAVGHIKFNEVSKYKLDKARIHNMIGVVCKAKVLGCKDGVLAMSIRMMDVEKAEAAMVATSTLNTGDVMPKHTLGPIEGYVVRA
jgi:predicted RNA-binding protein with RPS1 domain